MQREIWTEIKLEYIATHISYRQLAEKHGVSFRTLADRGKREGWVCEREKYRGIVVSKTVQKIADDEAVRNGEKLIIFRVILDQLTDVLMDILNDTEQLFRRFGHSGTIYKKADVTALKSLTGALKDIVAVFRDVYDYPTKLERFYMDIAEQKLALNKQRLALAKQKAGDTKNDDTKTGVVILPEIIDDGNENEVLVDN